MTLRTFIKPDFRSHFSPIADAKCVIKFFRGGGGEGRGGGWGGGSSEKCLKWGSGGH